MITKQMLKEARPQDFRWAGCYLTFKGHYIVQILIISDYDGNPGSYIPYYTSHSFMTVQLHHGIASPDFNNVKKMAKEYIVNKIKEFKI